MHDDTTLQTLLAPVSDDAPAGPDLEYDPDFLRLERDSAIRAERSLGDSVIAAEEPDWDKVQTLALELSRRSRDLRIAGKLGAAWLRLRGLPGWADTLALIHGLLEQHWDSVHPQLDADDDNDPTSRINALVGLSDPMGLLGALRTTPFVQSPRLGRFSLRDLRVANGSIKLPEGQTGPSLAEIEACCLDCTPDTLAASAQSIAEALLQARAIDALLSERVGTAAPDLRPLLADLRDLERFVLPHWQARQGTAAVAEDGEQAAGEDHATTPTTAMRRTGEIAGPDDVKRRLEEICAYYARHEPSSPVPMLLRRAQRLVGCDFLALMKELAPAGIDDLQRVTGPLEDS
ncbi:type VI secretion system protein TssA [Xanthomonas vesicatoria]|uniref:type VI secretion system protein TssA n=1 Tax=Xanthomonas vesicatoria TaxID=56460 RepID=UPI0007321126|nr:type VI secretion system protein TssA [Xanthomonas vesicatoria]KTF33077.1 type VI secretion protein [Xanthomonas vesicatoria]MCC8557868.1 type VI secretion system protein TssA [Xanthomonas vesicatoria]MCC8599769.1 type VI secretion system protein TssA [Xanthomonas vesicatoria]MCC8608932.1 type VI secretion system protein TssA [Xanthomonas vesicatoria]MCC8673414.1 type VI secretion system protein TssA [Xanthomonas vesicatoria]